MPVTAPSVFYPESDGMPMAENTVQFDWIAMLKWTAEAQFRNQTDVFVAGDHLIYPVEGNNTLSQAPDTYLAFGRPKGDRGSYRVWDENGIFPQVVFEVWSPSNRPAEMNAKRLFYETYGAEEYYLIRPQDPQNIEAWIRHNHRLLPITNINTFTSPRLGWRFHVPTHGDIAVLDPDGRPLQRPDQIAAERDELIVEREDLLIEREDLVSERNRLATERARLAAKLRALGIDPDA